MSPIPAQADVAVGFLRSKKTMVMPEMMLMSMMMEKTTGRSILPPPRRNRAYLFFSTREYIRVSIVGTFRCGRSDRSGEEEEDRDADPPGGPRPGDGSKRPVAPAKGGQSHRWYRRRTGTADPAGRPQLFSLQQPKGHPCLTG